MPRKIPCLGMSISGRISARSHMQTLSFIVALCKKSGWGIVLPLQTAGEKHVARMCNRYKVFCIGLFTSKFCSPEFRGALAMEVDTYTREEREATAQLYNAIGKSMVWEQMPESRRCLMTSTLSMVTLSKVVAVWPESQEVAVASAVAGAKRRPLFYLPESFGGLTKYIAANATMFETVQSTSQHKAVDTFILGKES